MRHQSRATKRTAKGAALNDNLAKEYIYLTSVWDDFDRRALTIKGWSAAGAGAALLGLVSGTGLSIAIAAAAAILLICFWVLEAFWKRFQHSNHSRILLLEKHFAGIRKLEAPFQCHTTSGEVIREWGWRRLLHEMRQPIVLIPYLPLLVAIAIAVAATSVTAPASPGSMDKGNVAGSQRPG